LACSHGIPSTWSGNNTVRVAISGKTDYSGYLDDISSVLQATRLESAKRDSFKPLVGYNKLQRVKQFILLVDVGGDHDEGRKAIPLLLIPESI